MLSGEGTNTNFIVFSLTRTGIEHTIYLSRCEHANNYTTDAVSNAGIYTQQTSNFALNMSLSNVYDVCAKQAINHSNYIQ